MAAAASSGLQISSLQSLNLDLPPSCVEFAPAHPAYFLVGTYNLEKEEGSSALPEEEEGGDGDEGADQIAAKKVQSRNGSIVVYRLSDGGGMTHVQTEAHPSAILDLHFQGLEERKHVCGVVSSTGAMSIFSFAPESGKALPLKQLGTVRLPTIGEDVLFLSFCWHPSLRDVAAVTTSTGHVHLLRLDAGYTSCSTLHSPVISHDLEAWCVAISPPPPGPGLPGEEGMEKDDSKAFTLYSGGDDSTLRYTTCTLLLKDGNNDEAASHDGSVLEATSPYSPVKVSGHGAGVTAILPLPSSSSPSPSPSPRGGGATPAIVITGSYDDRIRAFAVAPLHETHGVRRVTQLAECDLGGGVWRLKLVVAAAAAVEDGRKAEVGGVVAPGEGGQDENEEEEENEEGEDEQEKRGYERKAVVLVSCMHAGARIVELLRVRQRRGGDNEWRFRVLGRFEEHRSMNYGSDFQPCPASSPAAQALPVLGGLRCVSTSFYDKLLCSWEFRP